MISSKFIWYFAVIMLCLGKESLSYQKVGFSSSKTPEGTLSEEGTVYKDGERMLWVSSENDKRNLSKVEQHFFEKAKGTTLSTIWDAAEFLKISEIVKSETKYDGELFWAGAKCKNGIFHWFAKEEVGSRATVLNEFFQKGGNSSCRMGDGLTVFMPLNGTKMTLTPDDDSLELRYLFYLKN